MSERERKKKAAKDFKFKIKIITTNFKCSY